MSAPYVHLEGMGVLGSLLALCLERAKVNFTWHDTLETHTAWHASTGCVYPILRAESKSARGYACWRNWLDIGLIPRQWRCTELGVPWFNGKTAPHQGGYEPSITVGALHSDPAIFSVHLNAQRFVPLVRQRFAARRLEKNGSQAQHYVVAHGFNNRLSHYFWGWAAPVRLILPASMTKHSDLRPSIYTRYKRFEMAYAYPIPGSELWYAGSSLIHQRVPRELDVVKHFTRWWGIFERLSGGSIRVQRAGPPLQGWRPAAAKTGEEKAAKDNQLKVLRQGRKLVVPPLYHSGVRHSPLVVEQVFNMLKLPKGVLLP